MTESTSTSIREQRKKNKEEKIQAIIKGVVNKYNDMYEEEANKVIEENKEPTPAEMNTLTKTVAWRLEVYMCKLVRDNIQEKPIYEEAYKRINSDFRRYFVDENPDGITTRLKKRVEELKKEVEEKEAKVEELRQKVHATEIRVVEKREKGFLKTIINLFKGGKNEDTTCRG